MSTSPISNQEYEMLPEYDYVQRWPVQSQGAAPDESRSQEGPAAEGRLRVRSAQQQGPVPKRLDKFWASFQVFWSLRL